MCHLDAAVIAPYQMIRRGEQIVEAYLAVIACVAKKELFALRKRNGQCVYIVTRGLKMQPLRYFFLRIVCLPILRLERQIVCS